MLRAMASGVERKATGNMRSSGKNFRSQTPLAQICADRPSRMQLTDGLQTRFQDDTSFVVAFLLGSECKVRKHRQVVGGYSR
jgi:hypothetical protein